LIPQEGESEDEAGSLRAARDAPIVEHGEPPTRRYLVVYVGPRKFARIVAGWRESTGMDLRRVRFA